MATFSTRGRKPSDASVLLQVLTDKQFTNPHADLGATLERLADQTGCCQLVARRALGRLDLDPATRLGRLRRTELSQLARSMYRLWRPALRGETVAA